MQLSGPQVNDLVRVLQASFTPEEFDRMLLLRLDQRRTDISLHTDMVSRFVEVISWYNRRYEVEKLVQAVQVARPHRPELSALARKWGAGTELTNAAGSGRLLERTIKRANSFLEVAEWRTRMARAETQVCRVEVLDKISGTGFLVGPSAVMTNYHVIEPLIKDQLDPAKLTLRFDYTLLPASLNASEGTLFRLDEEWLIDSSPYSELDKQAEPAEEPGPEYLDYGLLRVAGAPGVHPVEGLTRTDEQAPSRGWISLPSGEHDFEGKPAMMILQHPYGRTLKLAIDTEAVIGVNRKRTRVRYRTNTEPGSSGSPCFDIDWNLIALHHSGDPGYSKFKRPLFNQGIPVATITAHLSDRALAALEQ